MADVSRETVPPADLAVVTQLVPPDRVGLLERYAGLLATQGVDRGLLGPREVPRLWDRHLLNCALLAPLVPADASVGDLGSGAGLPGVVLAIARPDLRIALVEPMARRVVFLEETVGELGLEGVDVVRGRAEQLAQRLVEPAPDIARFDVVTARALAELPKLLDWSLPLVSTGGCVLAMKGANAQAEIDAAAGDLRRWGATAEVVRSSVPGASEMTAVRVVRTAGSEIGWRARGARRRGRKHA
jgi:16S rRNA (guanine527-N7)-methyltransferase